MKFHHFQRYKGQEGFSLVELSIVLIILGLMVVGVMAGSTLIRQAEIRAVVSEVERHITEIKTFQEKYGYFPGDMPNATSFWLSATCPAGLVPSGCNGDGDQRMNDIMENSATERAEKYRVWQHLVLAGMMEGNFTGLKVPGSTDGGDSTNSPASVKEGGLYYVGWDNFYGFVPVQNMICLGTAITDNAPYGDIWSPRDAYQVDHKMDNGLPYSGNMVSNDTSSADNCVTSSNYALSYSNTACRSCFMLDMVSVNGK